MLGGTRAARARAAMGDAPGAPGSGPRRPDWTGVVPPASKRMSGTLVRTNVAGVPIHAPSRDGIPGMEWNGRFLGEFVLLANDDEDLPTLIWALFGERT